jgi:hypothetical protein
MGMGWHFEQEQRARLKLRRENAKLRRADEEFRTGPDKRPRSPRAPGVVRRALNRLFHRRSERG